jgi:P-type E1-E2 ATPase
MPSSSAVTRPESAVATVTTPGPLLFRYRTAPNRAAAAEEAGQTAVFADWDGQVRGVLTVADTVKPTSSAAIARLRGTGLRPVMLTGDNERAARAVADAAGIGEVIAGVLPTGKVDAVARLQAAGRLEHPRSRAPRWPARCRCRHLAWQAITMLRVSRAVPSGGRR